MPKYKNQIAHALGQELAIERLRVNTEWARGISDLQGTWAKNTFTFSVSIQGIVLKGYFQVEEDSLKSEVQLPLIAMPFKSWLPNILRNALRTKEITSYPRNVNPNKPLANSLSTEARKAIRERNELDYELHKYALNLMDEAIAAEGSEFYDDLEQYKKLASAHQDSA